MRRLEGAFGRAALPSLASLPVLAMKIFVAWAWSAAAGSSSSTRADRQKERRKTER